MEISEIAGTPGSQTEETNRFGRPKPSVLSARDPLLNEIQFPQKDFRKKLTDFATCGTINISLAATVRRTGPVNAMKKNGAV